MPEFENPVLQVRNLSKIYGPTCEYCRNRQSMIKNYCPKCSSIYACRDVSFDLYEGEILGIVGESGSGKSTVVKSLYLDTDASQGEFYLKHYQDGQQNILGLDSNKHRYVKDFLLSMVYQNAYMGLKMDFSSVSNVAEKLIAAGSRKVSEMKARSEYLLDLVKIPDYRRLDPPRQFSGGMQQRVQIAKALSNNSPVIFLDELTTGLDLSVQANVLELVKDIQRDLKISMVVVSHDLSVIRMLAGRTLVMLDGEIIEQGLTDQILEDPIHAYTQELVHSLL